MSKTYFRTKEMYEGGPFKCPNCNKTLANKIQGSIYIADFMCPRCKTIIHIECNEPIPFIAEHINECKNLECECKVNKF